jgi:glutathione S-transferase
MKLYGSFTSPFVRHCRVALNQSGYEFEFVETDYSMSAEMSPTSKVPFLVDGELMLSDSSAILRYVREKSGQAFLADLDDYDTYLLVNTVLDSTVNVFLIENDGFGPNQIPYLGRQNSRINSGLAEMERRIDPSRGIEDDSVLRCACFVDWAIFRNRINFDGYVNLTGLLESANRIPEFSTTAPPR